MTLLLTFLGFLCGASLGSLAGALVGAAAGAALGFARTQQRELADLRRQVANLTRDQHPLDPVRPDASTAPSAARTFVSALKREAPDDSALDDSDWPGTAPVSGTPRARPPRVTNKWQRDLKQAGGQLREFLGAGNSIARVGLLVLLVGVVLLLKYATEHAMFPIELRLGSAALIGFALVAVGLRQRLARPGFGRSLQGGGVAVLYLVIFFSFRVYELLPAGLAFGLLAGIAVFSGMLAVSQNSLSLIVIGILGGFMAPVLASTGEGHHVALFSYYLILNLLIVGVAWFRSWRPLNLLGFVFTFGIGSTWGALRYRAEDFASTEPFLIAFFLLYVAIVVIFAWRRPAKLRGWVDGSLTFGTPLAVLVLQYAMVHERPFGMAYTTFGMALVYVMAAYVLFRRAPAALRNLLEAFLVLGVGFATLALPYGFSNQSLTGATWAIEGLGLVWMGLRQKRRRSCLAGVALQPMAGGALLWSLAHLSADEGPALLNAPFAAFTLVSLSGLGIAWLAARHAALWPRALKILALFVPWSVVWWGLGGLREVLLRVEADYRVAVLLLFMSASGLAFELMGRRLNWRNGRLPGLLVVPGLFAVLLSAYRLKLLALNLPQPARGDLHGFEFALSVDPLGKGGIIAWPLYVLGMGFTSFRFSRDHGSFMRGVHAVALWGVGLLVALVLGYEVREVASIGANWAVVAVGAGLLLVLGCARWLGPKIAVKELRAVVLEWGAGGLGLVLVIWQVRTNLMASGAVEPLPYIPLLNVLDVTLGLAWIACWSCARSLDLNARPLFLGMGFLWFNGMLARTVAHNNGLHFELHSLWNSVALQVGVSISWTLIGLGALLWATRKRSRSTWFWGAGLLALVVGKLFLHDLAHLSPVSKIGTFLLVGVLLVVVGYFSPVPPRALQQPVPGPEPERESP